MITVPVVADQASAWDWIATWSSRLSPLWLAFAGALFAQLRHWLKTDFVVAVDTRVSTQIAPLKDKVALMDDDLRDARERLGRLEGWKQDFAEEINTTLADIRRDTRDTRDTAKKTEGAVTELSRQVGGGRYP